MHDTVRRPPLHRRGPLRPAQDDRIHPDDQVAITHPRTHRQRSRRTSDRLDIELELGAPALTPAGRWDRVKWLSSDKVGEPAATSPKGPGDGTRERCYPVPGDQS